MPSNGKSLKQLSAEGFFRCGNRNGSCSYLTQLPIQFDAHMIEEHADEYVFPCVHCGSVETTCDSLLQHLEEHLTHQSLLLYCAEPTCDFSSLSPEDVLQHIAVSHSTLSRFTCWCCSARFSSIHTFVTHVKHNLLQVVRCPHCSAKDKDRQRILAHISSSHPDLGRMVRIHKILLCQERILAAWQAQNAEHAQLQEFSIRNHLPVPLKVSPVVHNPNLKQETDCTDVTGSYCDTPEHVDNVSDDEIIIDLDMVGNNMFTENSTDRGADRDEFLVQWPAEKLEQSDYDVSIVTEGENNQDKVESSVMSEDRNEHNGAGEKEREINLNTKEGSAYVATASVVVNHSNKQFEDEQESNFEVVMTEETDPYEEETDPYSSFEVQNDVSNDREYLRHTNEQSEEDMLERESERADLGCVESLFNVEYVDASNTDAEYAAEKQESKVLKSVLQEHAAGAVAHAQEIETSSTDYVPKSELSQTSVQPEASDSLKSSHCQENSTDPATSASTGLSSLLPSEDDSNAPTEMEYRCPYCVSICKTYDEFHAHLCCHLRYQCYKCGHCFFFKGYSKGAVLNHIKRFHPQEKHYAKILPIVRKDKEAKLQKMIVNCHVPVSDPYTDRQMKAMEKAALRKKKKKTQKLKALVPTKKSTSAAVHNSTQSGNEEPWLMCPYCKKQRKTKTDVENEIRYHIHYKPFSCPHCTEKPFESSTYHRVQQHIQKEHPHTHLDVTVTRIHKKEEKFKALLQRAISISKVSSVQKARATAKTKFSTNVRPQKHTAQEPSVSSISSNERPVALTTRIRTKDCFLVVSSETEITYSCNFCDYIIPTKPGVYNQELARKRKWKHVFNKHKEKPTAGRKR